jgi:hypothetical protein
MAAHNNYWERRGEERRGKRKRQTGRQSLFQVRYKKCDVGMCLSKQFEAYHTELKL